MAGDRRFEPWPVALCAMLAAMIAVSLAFYAVAASHVDAEVVDDSYAAGLRFNDELAAQRRAEARGLRIELSPAAAPGGVDVTLRLRDAGGRPVAADTATLRRERPTRGGYDADFTLQREGDAWRGAIPLPLHGRWQLLATVLVDGDPVRQRVAVWHAP
jgi:nitrogen fixation protein FixH